MFHQRKPAAAEDDAGLPGSVKRSRGSRLVIAIVALVAAVGCAKGVARCVAGAGGLGRACALPGYEARSFDLTVPPGDAQTKRPLVIAFHGGGGSRRSAETVTCPSGKPDDPGCLGNIALARGFVVARPDGTGARLLPNVRTWNAGGGQDGFQCVSGRACKDGVDDIAYVRALLDEIARLTPIDERRVFLTGLSNGGAFAHRVACELGDRVAGIVAVAGANQYVTAGATCQRPVPVLHIHGTDDPCWGYAGGTAACAQDDGGRKQSVDASMAAWAKTNGCTGSHMLASSDRAPADGTTLVKTVYDGCKAPTELWKLEGGGHGWPNGHPYFGERRIGKISREASSEDVVAFFERATTPP